MEPIFELKIELPARGSRDLLRALHAQLRAAIIDGRLKPGLPLPPTRAFASLYDVSRNTAVAVYDLLLSEGYVTSRRGAGTYVADSIPQPRPRRVPTAAPPTDRRLNAFWRERRVTTMRTPYRPPRYNFQVGAPDIARFPFDLWRRLSGRTLRTLAKAPSVYWEPQGRWALREAIAKHVSFARAVACRPEDVVVTAGAQQAFDLLARILVTPGRTTVAMEDPGYWAAQAAFVAAGARIVPVPVDVEGMVVERIPADAKVVYVTPSHQFPLGAAMSMPRRSALLEFARTRGAVVIEDDYDGEFRFGGRPLDALQTLDRSESVLYVGTFSKSLLPGLRLGFVVAPPWANQALAAAKQHVDCYCPVQTQDLLATFIAEGHLARHIRKMRALYSARREVLLDGLRKDFGRWLEPAPSIAGLHLTAFSKAPLNADALVERARADEICIHSLGPNYMGKPTRAGVVFGYGALSERAIVEGLAALRKLMPG